VIAPGGGWSAASITGMGADVFDERLGQHSSHGPIIADLIEYRLRAVLNGKSGKEANISHAVFFNWWSYKNTPNKRHARSQYEWWGKLKRSSAFIYLIEKHGYPKRPPTINDVDFWEFLEKPPIHQTILRDFFSKYAFITQQLEDETLVAISAGPLPIDVKPFSEDEIAVLDAYEHHYEEMN
jgi:hypothetical protein